MSKECITTNLVLGIDISQCQSSKYQIPAIIKLFLTENTSKNGRCLNCFTFNIFYENTVHYPKKTTSNDVLDFFFEVKDIDPIHLSQALTLLCQAIKQKVNCHIQYTYIEKITTTTEYLKIDID